jgi:probable DNA metabolism protein
MMTPFISVVYILIYIKANALIHLNDTTSMPGFSGQPLAAGITTALPWVETNTTLMYSEPMSQMELFEENRREDPADIAELFSINSELDAEKQADLTGLYELAQSAYYSALYARMSGLPLKGEISRFIEKVLKAGEGQKTERNRAAADNAASDRGDPDVLAVLKAAQKVGREIHRLNGLLRFSPEADGTYIARCAPDYFILPALAEHFSLRFAETPWAIIDEKRCLCLKGDADGVSLSPCQSPAGKGSNPCDSTHSKDTWEDLWRLYHRSINNEARSNPRLQRQFMPARYHKYLPELH